MQKSKGIARLILSFLEDPEFSGPSEKTNQLSGLNLDWNKIVRQKYPKLRACSLLNHLKRSFVAELALSPKLAKFKNDPKLLLGSWQKMGGSVVSDQNVVKSCLRGETL